MRQAAVVASVSAAEPKLAAALAAQIKGARAGSSDSGGKHCASGTGGARLLAELRAEQRRALAEMDSVLGGAKEAHEAVRQQLEEAARTQRRCEDEVEAACAVRCAHTRGKASVSCCLVAWLRVCRILLFFVRFLVCPFAYCLAF